MANYDYVVEYLLETEERIFKEENIDINRPITYFSETALRVPPLRREISRDDSGSRTSTLCCSPLTIMERIYSITQLR